MTREEAIAYGKRVIDLGLNDETQDFCELAIKVLEQQPCEDVISRYGVLHKIAEFFSNWDGKNENAKMEISVNDMREISSMFVTKCRAESKLKALEQHNIDKLISKLEDEKFKLYDDDIHSGFDGGLERAKQIVKEFYEVSP